MILATFMHVNTELKLISSVIKEEEKTRRKKRGSKTKKTERRERERERGSVSNAHSIAGRDWGGGGRGMGSHLVTWETQRKEECESITLRFQK